MTLKEIVGVSLFGFFCVVFQPAHADRLDTLETYAPIPYCKEITGMFYSGALSKVNGFAKVIKPADATIIAMIEHKLPLPKSAIWATQWDQLNDREKEFMTFYVFAGYDSGAESEDEAAQKAQGFFETCVRYRVAEKRI